MQRDGWIIPRLTAGKTVQITPGWTISAGILRPAGAVTRVQQRGWKTVTHRVLMLKARPATPSAPPSCFSCCKLAVWSQDFFPPRFLYRKKSSSSGIILSKACRKTHAVPSRRQKKLPRTAGAGASEFLVVKRQGARCLAQNNYKLHALLHFINLS